MTEPHTRQPGGDALVSATNTVIKAFNNGELPAESVQRLQQLRHLELIAGLRREERLWVHAVVGTHADEPTYRLHRWFRSRITSRNQRLHQRQRQTRPGAAEKRATVQMKAHGRSV